MGAISFKQGSLIVTTVESDQVGLVAQARLDIFDRVPSYIGDSAEDQDLFILLVIAHHSHTVVADVT